MSTPPAPVGVTNEVPVPLEADQTCTKELQ